MSASHELADGYPVYLQPIQLRTAGNFVVEELGIEGPSTDRAVV